ncbi:MAG: TRAM domain-containing protein, partial [Candidatus Promineifilaceae bacterium]
LQKEVSQEKMLAFLDSTVEVLVEGKQKDRWRGRNPQNKLVFFPDPRELRGQLVQVHVKHAGPWSMSGEAIDRPEVQRSANGATRSIPLAVH